MQARSNYRAERRKNGFWHGDFLRNVVEPQLEDGKNIVIIGHGVFGIVIVVSAVVPSNAL